MATCPFKDGASCDSNCALRNGIYCTFKTISDNLQHITNELRNQLITLNTVIQNLQR